MPPVIILTCPLSAGSRHPVAKLRGKPVLGEREQESSRISKIGGLKFLGKASVNWR
jgi:hypothetical protein